MKIIRRAALTSATALSALVACGCWTLTTSSSSNGGLASCPTGTGRAAVQRWEACGGAEIISSVRADLDRIGVTDRGSVRMRTECGRLEYDAGRGRTFDGIPDATAEKHWALALGYFINGAQECQRGQYAAASTDIGKGGDESQQASSRLEVILR